MQGLKNFVASQGGGLLTGGSQSAPPQGAGLFPGGAPNQSQPGFSGFGQTPINGLQNNGTWLQPGQEPHPDGTLQADKLKIEGVQLYKNKQYQASVRKFEQAYSLDPSETMKKGYATALNAYANQLNTEGHYAEAVEYSRRALQLTPENTLIQRNAHAFAENLDSQRAGTLPGQ